MHALKPLLAIAAAGFVTFAAQAESRYDNPVDKKTYVTPGEFKTYQPDKPRDQRGQRVTTEGVMLLTGEPDLKARTTVQELAAFIKEVEVRAYTELAKNKSAMSALVQFDCQPASCAIKLASQGDADKATLQALHDSLSRMPALKPRGDVAFQVKFNVGS